MSYIIEIYFRCVAYCTSQFKNFSYPNITKKVGEINYCLRLHCLFHPSENTCSFFEKNKNKL